MPKSFDTYYTDFRLGGKRKNPFAGGSRSHGQDFGNANILSREPDWHSLDDVQLASAVHDYQLATAKDQAGVRQAHYNFAHATNQKSDFKAIFNILASSERVGAAAQFEPGGESPHYAIPNFVYDRLGSKYRGGSHFYSMRTPDHKRSVHPPPHKKKQRLRGPKPQPIPMSAMDVEGKDVSQDKHSLKRKYLHSMVHSDETNQLIRLRPVSFRLRAPKSYTLPGMLSDLFMPKLTSRLSFGFTSNTGFGKIFPADDAGNSVTGIAGAAPRGNYRGVVLTKFRFTDKDVNRDATNALNAKGVERSQTVDGLNVISSYRNFQSAPAQANNGTASQVTQNQIQTITADPTTDATMIRQLGVGANLTHFEDHAYQATNFLQSVGNATNTGNIGTTDTEDVNDWNGRVPILQGTGAGPTPGPEDPYWYPNNAKEGIMRICDGYVEFDISNSSKTSVIVEIVLHSMKKCAININSPEIYKQLYNNYDYYTKSQYHGNDPASAAANKPGGWQTFYDPEVPLLSCPKKFNKSFEAYEVHRSNHILGVGQSKVVKISFGSLVYKLGNKSDSVLSNESDDLKTYTKRDNASTILCAIGHTGFDALESLAVTGDTVNNATLGNGLWAGKSASPSSLVVAGHYQEQYYPMYMYSTGRILGNHGVNRPAWISDGGLSMGLPQNKIVATTVATVDADKLGAAIAQNATGKPQ